uniref:Uncharacterized protein n=1 Tax=Hyaloperonospora arabidopsidis (strain Emoy2) TaxID=559515 RepID=M4BD89_HYAAE
MDARSECEAPLALLSVILAPHWLSSVLLRNTWFGGSAMDISRTPQRACGYGMCSAMK